MGQLPVDHISSVLGASNELLSWSNENTILPNMSLLNACVVSPSYCAYKSLSKVSIHDIVNLRRA